MKGLSTVRVTGIVKEAIEDFRRVYPFLMRGIRTIKMRLNALGNRLGAGVK